MRTSSLAAPSRAALEFEVAADIIGSVVSPGWQEIGRPDGIAVIGTFLNDVLEKDLVDADAPKAAA